VRTVKLNVIVGFSIRIVAFEHVDNNSEYAKYLSLSMIAISCLLWCVNKQDICYIAGNNSRCNFWNALNIQQRYPF